MKIIIKLIPLFIVLLTLCLEGCCSCQSAPTRKPSNSEYLSETKSERKEDSKPKTNGPLMLPKKELCEPGEQALNPKCAPIEEAATQGVK